MLKKLYIYVAIVVAAISCSKIKTVPDNVLANILFEMHIADAIVNFGELKSGDSIRIYEPIAEKYGYSLAEVKHTMLKHTTKEDKLQEIYDKVSLKIAHEKEINTPLARIEKLSQNMYKGGDSIEINSITFNQQRFEVGLEEFGIYDIHANYLFFENDSTKNPVMTVWLASSTFKDSVIQKQEIALNKDSLYTNYSLQITHNNPTFTILKGFWVDFEKRKQDTVKITAKNKPVKVDSTYRQHIHINSMTIKYNFEKSDSITTKMKEAEKEMEAKSALFN